MKKSVWLVYEGVYSDRDVIYVASTKEQAELFNKKYCSDPMEIIEVPIDEELEEESIYKCVVNITKDGFQTQLLYSSMIDKAMLSIMKDEEITHGYIRYFNMADSNIQLQMTIHAGDIQHSLKIANEWLMMIVSQPFLYPDVFSGNNGSINFYHK